MSVFDKNTNENNDLEVVDSVNSGPNQARTVCEHCGQILAGKCEDIPIFRFLNTAIGVHIVSDWIGDNADLINQGGHVNVSDLADRLSAAFEYSASMASFSPSSDCRSAISPSRSLQ